jgi:hypothetical protein
MAAGLFALAALAAAAASCAPPPPGPAPAAPRGAAGQAAVPQAAAGPAPDAVDRGASCELRRPLLLAEPVVVRAAPSDDAARIAALPRNEPVFRCDARDGWIRVMFRAPGRPADCSPGGAGAPCPVGWVWGPRLRGLEPG